jgi:hypothetical protein
MSMPPVPFSVEPNREAMVGFRDWHFLRERPVDADRAVNDLEDARGCPRRRR